jgi:hypothetical protein
MKGAKNVKKKLLISNLVYGDVEVYPKIFVEHHLRSLLDLTNAPLHADRLGYMIYSDPDTHRWLKEQRAFQDLKKLMPVKVEHLTWPQNTEERRYQLRYAALASMLKQSIAFGLERDCYLSTIVADLVFAQGFFDKIFAHLDAGFDSVFMHPLRSAWEGMRKIDAFNKLEALAPMDLFQLGYENLHPLWQACHYRAPQFSKHPDTLLWNTGTGLMARTFSVTPIAFTPYESMRDMKQVIDVGVPPLCKKPYICKDWTDAPVIGVEPIIAWWPPFENHGASVRYIEGKDNSDWRLNFSNHKLFYPDEKTVNITEDQDVESNIVINTLNGISAM